MTKELYLVGIATDQWVGSGLEISFEIEWDDETSEFVMRCEITGDAEDWAIENDSHEWLEYTRNYIEQFKGKRFETIEEIDEILKEELPDGHGARKTVDGYFEVC